MSNLALPNGDDHPEAAQKNLADAQILCAQHRPDGAGYLSGYVVECALKALWLIEVGVPSGPAPWGRRGHDLSYLRAQVSALATVAGASTAKYFGASVAGVSTSAIATWTPELRYRPPMITERQAEAWCREAEAIFNETMAPCYLTECSDVYSF